MFKVKTKNSAFKYIMTSLLMALLFVMITVMVYPWTAVAYTQWDFIGSASEIYFEADYQTKNEVITAASEHDVNIGREGVVMLENKADSEGNLAMPIDITTQAVHIIGDDYSYELGTSTYWIDGYDDTLDFLYSGSGSSNGVRNDEAETIYTFEKAFEQDYGYTNYKVITEEEISAGTDLSGGDNDNVAVLIVTRQGAENTDYGRWRSANNMTYDDGGHELRLNEYEIERLIYACNNYNNVTVWINTGTQFEVGFIKDPAGYFDAQTGIMPMGGAGEYTQNMTQSDLDNIVAHLRSGFVIHYLGDSAVRGFTEVMFGDVSPSGRLAATWYHDFFDDPSYQNFGSYKASSDSGRYVYYQEGIYVGYRYYETRGYEETKANADSTWYEDNVDYTIGYGLSYTEFEYDIVSSSLDTDNTLYKNGKVTIDVEVTNVGDVAGKEVVQVYSNAPYTDGGIEKSIVTMVDFQKTDILQPDESEIVTLTFDVEDMKVYDGYDDNHNGFKGYELEAGTYNLIVSKDAHSWADYDSDLTIQAVVPENSTLDENVISKATTGTTGIIYDTDMKTGYKVENIFDEVSDSLFGNGSTTGWQYMSRSDFEATFPIAGGDSRIADISDQGRELIATSDYNNPDMPWYVDEEDMPTQADVAADSNEIQIYHMMGREFDDTLWDELLDQLSFTEMAGLVSDGFQYITGIDSIGLPRTYMNDGPLGWNSTGTGTYKGDNAFKYSSFCLNAQTYNRDIQYERGRLQGSEGNLGNIELATNGGNYFTYGAVWSPGMNIHRSPFGGRNFEYFSEDPFLNGEMAGAVIEGLNDMGVRNHTKHFFLNEQETNRKMVSIYASEQSMREIYAKGFEITMKDHGSTGAMTSFCRIGRINSSESYAQNQTLARDEWGFNGMIMTDWKDQSWGSAMLRAGTDIPLDLDTTYYYNNVMNEEKTATHVTAVRESVHHILYAIASSASMNGLGGTALESVATAGRKTYMLSNSEVTEDISYIASNRSNTPYTFSITGGDTLPSGLTLTEDGLITGTTTESGTFSIQVTANEKDLEPYGDATELGNKRLFIPYTAVTTTIPITIFATEPDYLIFDDFTLGTTVKIGMENELDIGMAAYYTTDGFKTDGVSYALAEGVILPTGLSLTSTGYIVGDPHALSDGISYDIEVIASHPSYDSSSAIVTINCILATTTYSQDDFDEVYYGVVGSSFSASFGTATTTSDGTLNYSITGANSLPEGLNLNTSTGIISGTPLRAYENLAITITAKVTGADDVSISVDLTIYGISQADINESVQVDRYFYIDLSETTKLISSYETDARIYYALDSDSTDEDTSIDDYDPDADDETDTSDDVVVDTDTEIEEASYTLSADGKLVGYIDGIGTIEFKITITAYGCVDVVIQVIITVYEI